MKIYKNIKTWENKLEYVSQILEDVKSFDTSWYDFEQRLNYQDILQKQERKVKEYQELVNYLKGVNE